MTPSEFDLELNMPLPGSKAPVPRKVVDEEMRLFRQASSVLNPGG